MVVAPEIDRRVDVLSFRGGEEGPLFCQGSVDTQMACLKSSWSQAWFAYLQPQGGLRSLLHFISFSGADSWYVFIPLSSFLRAYVTAAEHSSSYQCGDHIFQLWPDRVLTETTGWDICLPVVSPPFLQKQAHITVKVPTRGLCP